MVRADRRMPVTEKKPDKIECLGEDEWFSDPNEPVYWLTCVDDGSEGNRRLGERHKAFLKVLVDPGGRPAASGDLSIGGMLVLTDRPMEIGRAVSISISTMDGVQHADGLVRWVSHGCSRGEDISSRQCMGIQFTWVTLGMRDLLKSVEEV